MTKSFANDFTEEKYSEFQKSCIGFHFSCQANILRISYKLFIHKALALVT